MARIRKWRLNLNKWKCVFGAKSILFIGHSLIDERISSDPFKVRSDLGNAKSNIKNWPSVVGMIAFVSNLCKFIWWN